MDRRYKNINYLVECEQSKALIGKIVKCQKTNGRIFCAKLIAVTPSGELWFETRSGNRTMDKRHTIDTIVPYEPCSSEVVA